MKDILFLLDMPQGDDSLVLPPDEPPKQVIIYK